MATFVMKDFLKTRHLVYLQVRFSRNRVNVQRPLPTHLAKQQFLKITKPYFMPDERPLVEKCRRSAEVIPVPELNPLDKIYAQELRQLFRESKLSAVFARNPMSVEDLHLVRVMLFKADMKLVIRNRRIVKKALEETEFVNLLPLFDSDNMMAFSSTLNINDLFNVCKRESRVTLLAAVFENRILSVSDLMALSNVSDIQASRALLAQVLQSSAQNIHRSLEVHQNTLLNHLHQRVEQLRDSSTDMVEIKNTSPIKEDSEGR